MNPGRVRDGQVIPDDLDSSGSGKVRPRGPFLSISIASALIIRGVDFYLQGKEKLTVILVKGVLDRDNVVTSTKARVEVGELRSREPLGGVRVGVLETLGQWWWRVRTKTTKGAR